MSVLRRIAKYLKNVQFAAFVPPLAVAVGLLFFVAVLIVQTAQFRSTFEDTAERDIAGKTDLAAAFLTSALERGDIDAVKGFCEARRSEGIRVSIIDLSGHVVEDSDANERTLADHSHRREFVSAKAGQPLTIVRNSETLNKIMLYRAQRVGNYILRLAISYDGAMKPLRLARHGLITSAFVGGLVVIGIFLLTRRLQTRIGAISRERDEKARMLAETSRLENFRRDFVANVSHEIKTPLTGILGAVEALEDDGSLSSEDRASLFAILRKQSTRLNLLVQDILSLGHLDSIKTDSEKDFSPCALDTIVASAVSLATPKADAAGVKLILVRNDEVNLDGDAQLLEQAVTNLIENALRYSGSKQVDVSLSREVKRAVIEVRDYGIGVAPEHQGRLFERFYRVDKARSRALGGTGLGLAIVKHVAMIHGGEAIVSSSLGCGCSFRIVIPLMA